MSNIAHNITKQLHAQVLNLMDDIITVCPNDSDILLVRIFFENNVSPELLMKEFIKWVYPWKENIVRRDLNFFFDNDHPFGPLPLNKVKEFRVRLKDGTFDENDVKAIWDYFDVFTSLVEKYNKVK